MFGFVMSPMSSLRAGLLLLAMGLVLLPGCTNKEFKTADLTSDAQVEQEAGKYWNRNGWWKLPEDAQTVAITEFTVEYVTATGTANQGFGLIRMAQIAGMGKKAFSFPDDAKAELPDRLYEQYVAALEEAGYDVVPAETLLATEGYEKLKLKDDGDRTKASSSQGVMVKQTVWQEGQIHSAKGLIARDDGWFNGPGNQHSETQAIGQAGADTGLRVRVKVGVDGKGRASLYPYSTVNVASGVHEIPWGPRGEETAFAAKVYGTMNSKQSLYFSEPIIDDKSFQAFKGDVYEVQGEPLIDAVTEVFPTFARLNIAAMR